jgi:hypothetical protein
MELVQEVSGLSGGWVTIKGTLPTLDPEEADLDLLQSQLDAVCGDPLWIDDSSLCTELADSLHVAEARLAINNFDGAASGVMGMGQLLAPNRKPSGSIEDNAYWLLKLNSDHVWNSLPDSLAAAGARLCAKSPSAGVTAYFTVTASGGTLPQSSPLQIGAEQTGVDPLGSSCIEVWALALADTLNVDVTVVADSMTAGYGVDEIVVSGGLDGDTTIAGPTATVITRHDGVTQATILFEIKASQSNPRPTACKALTGTAGLLQEHVEAADGTNTLQREPSC